MRRTMIIFMIFVLIVCFGCSGQQLSARGPVLTYENHSRTTVDFGGFGSKTGIGKEQSNLALQGNPIPAPKSSTIPNPMYSNVSSKTSVPVSNVRNYR